MPPKGTKTPSRGTPNKASTRQAPHRASKVLFNSSIAALLIGSLLLNYLGGVCTQLFARFIGTWAAEASKSLLNILAVVGFYAGYRFQNKSSIPAGKLKALSWAIAASLAFLIRLLTEAASEIFLYLGPRTTTVSEMELLLRWSAVALVGSGGAFLTFGWAMGYTAQTLPVSPQSRPLLLSLLPLALVLPSIAYRIPLYSTCIGPGLAATLGGMVSATTSFPISREAELPSAISMFLTSMFAVNTAYSFFTCGKCGPAGTHSQVWRCGLARGGLLSVVEGTPQALLDSEEASDLKYRVMRLDHSIMGGFWIEPEHVKGESVFNAFYLQAAARLLLPGSDDFEEESDEMVLEQGEQRSLHIGLGVGTTVVALQRRGFVAHVVEIHPEVVAVAEKYFDIQVKGETIIDDALHAVPALKDDTYDVAILDVFSGGIGPSALHSEQFLKELKRVLRVPGGALVVNYFGQQGPEFERLACRLKGMFDFVRVFAEKAPNGEEDPRKALRNIVFIGSDNLGIMIVDIKAAARVEVMKLGSEADITEAELLSSMASLEIELKWATEGKCQSVKSGEEREMVNQFLYPLEGLPVAAMHWKYMRQQLGDAFWVM